MTDLRSELQRIASEFVSAVLGAMNAAPLADLAQQSHVAAAAPPARAPRAPAPRPAPTRGRPAAARVAPPPAPPKGFGKRHRATAEEVGRQKDLAMATAKQLPAGFSKGDLMKRAGGKIDLGRALSLLVEEGSLTKKGDRRNTRYWVR